MAAQAAAAPADGFWRQPLQRSTARCSLPLARRRWRWRCPKAARWAWRGTGNQARRGVAAVGAAEKSTVVYIDPSAVIRPPAAAWESVRANIVTAESNFDWSWDANPVSPRRAGVAPSAAFSKFCEMSVNYIALKVGRIRSSMVSHWCNQTSRRHSNGCVGLGAVAWPSGRRRSLFHAEPVATHLIDSSTLLSCAAF